MDANFVGRGSSSGRSLPDRVEGRSTRSKGPLSYGPSYGNDAARGILRRRALGNSIIDNAVGFPYFRRLQGHTSCVNTLSFSHGDGRWLASGGDDLAILLWDFHQDDVKKPSHSMAGATGNIFCLEFSASNRFLYAGGTDRTIYKHDIEHISSAVGQGPLKHFWISTFTDHEDTIRAISTHPTHDEVFLSASEDGRIICHDTREARSRTQKLMMNSELSGVQYHPSMDNFFVSSNAKGQVYLHDARMAFEGDGHEPTRGKRGTVQKYTHLIERSNSYQTCNPEASSVTFNGDGSTFAVTYLHYKPVIYTVSDPHPIAVLSAKNLPDGTPAPENQKGYFNSCTMKHGAFGGANGTTGEMYAGGSDDFRNYIWKIPPVQWLLNRREEYSCDVWMAITDSLVAFTQGRDDTKYIPHEISTPFCRLTGYNSIVNTSAFHPHLLHVVSSGVEKDIFIHSPTPSSPCTQDLQLAPTQVRQLSNEDTERDQANYLSALLGGSPDAELNALDDESRALSLFDYIIRDEGDTDVFESRRCMGSDSSDSSDDDMLVESDDSDDDDDDEGTAWQ